MEWKHTNEEIVTAVGQVLSAYAVGADNVLSLEMIADLAGLEGPSREGLVHAAVRELRSRGRLILSANSQPEGLYVGNWLPASLGREPAQGDASMAQTIMPYRASVGAPSFIAGARQPRRHEGNSPGGSKAALPQSNGAPPQPLAPLKPLDSEEPLLIGRPRTDFIGEFALPREWYLSLQEAVGLADWHITWCVCSAEGWEKRRGKLIDGDTPYGLCGCEVPGAATILMRPGMDRSLEGYASIHEIIHAVVKQLVPGCDAETKERVVEQLAGAVRFSFLPTDWWPLGTAIRGDREQSAATNN